MPSHYVIGIVIAQNDYMKCQHESSFMWILVVSFMLLVLPRYLGAAPRPSISESDTTPMSKIISVTTKESEYGTTVAILGDGKIPDYRTATLDFPPKIIVDIIVATDPFESMNIPGTGSNLQGIRVGYHKGMIRLVLDVGGPEVPIFTTMAANNGLSIFLRSKGLTDERKGGLNKINHRKRKMEIPGFEKLIRIERDDGQDDTALFLKAVHSYRVQNWADAIDHLNQLIKTYPAGRYAERAYFLLAKSCEQLHSYSVEDYIIEIRSHYEDAISRFPGSEYEPSALLAIGNLCLSAQYYNEAIGYYSLAFKKAKDTDVASWALLKKVKILHLKKKRSDAQSLLDYLVHRYPGYPKEVEAKIEISKLYYEMNSFRKSLNILSDLVAVSPINIYQYPEISLYLGYNYYQMGDSGRARKNLLRFYNSYPERKMNHLVLTNIADTYRDEGLIEDAVKFYQLVLERYPETEAALISLIRLAEQQEEGKLRKRKESASPVRVIDREIAMPRKIYKDVLNNIQKKDKKNPLAQLAILKLALLYQREKDYDKSLETLKELLNEYPRTSLKNECKHALATTLEAQLNEKMNRGTYITVINTYLREKDLFSMINSPNLFLTVARAFIRLDFRDAAIEMFKEAEPLLSDKEKPADLLFYVGSDFFQKNELKGALSRFDLLIGNYPTDQHAPYAYKMKGSIFLKQEKYPDAADMFSSALRYGLKGHERARVSLGKATALMKCDRQESALKTALEAERSTKEHPIPNSHLYQDLGDLYTDLNHHQKALSVFHNAIVNEKDEESIIQLKFKIAQCYWSLGKKGDYLDQCNQISSLNDPFWSNLANERLEEMSFRSEIEKLESEINR
jgi:TolA-binding protein